jgi:hypothetical protein
MEQSTIEELINEYFMKKFLTLTEPKSSLHFIQEPTAGTQYGAHEFRQKLLIPLD